MTWHLTCWADQRVVQPGQGGGLLLGQPHPDLLPDPPGFGHRVRGRAVRGDHISGAGGVGLQGRQKAALRHRDAHPRRVEKQTRPETHGKKGGRGEKKRRERRRLVTRSECWVSAAKWRSVSGPEGSVGGTCRGGGDGGGGRPRSTEWPSARWETHVRLVLTRSGVSLKEGK